MGQLEARHVSENALPVIDISGLSSPDQKTRQAVGEEIRAARHEGCAAAEATL